MSKHATIGLTKQAGVELAGGGTLVNCIRGGIVDTPMWDLIDEGSPSGAVKRGVRLSRRLSIRCQWGGSRRLTTWPVP